MSLLILNECTPYQKGPYLIYCGVDGCGEELEKVDRCGGELEKVDGCGCELEKVDRRGGEIRKG